MMSACLKVNNVKAKDGINVNSIIRGMVGIIRDGALDEQRCMIRGGTDIFLNSLGLRKELNQYIFKRQD